MKPSPYQTYLRSVLLLSACIGILVNPSTISAEEPLKATDQKCGDYRSIVGEQNQACATNTSISGSQETTQRTTPGPDGTPKVEQVPTGQVQFPATQLKEAQAEIPTGTKDLKHLLGESSTQTEVTKALCENMNSFMSDYLRDKGPSTTNAGVFVRLLTVDRLATPDNLKTICEEFVSWYTEKSLGSVSSPYALPGQSNAATCNAAPSAFTVFPTWGPLQVTNRIWQSIRSPEAPTLEAHALSKLAQYQGTAAPQATSQSPSASQVLAAETGGGCVNGNCSTVKDEDTALCGLEKQDGAPFGGILQLPSLSLSSTRYPVQLTAADPALGGGRLYTDDDGESVIDFSTTYNYLVGPAVSTVSDLFLPLFTQERFAPGEGSEWKIDNLDDENAKFFGLGHKVAEKARACQQTSGVDELDEVDDHCGEAIDYIPGAATNLKKKGDITPEQTPTDSNYTPGFADPNCKACQLKSGSTISPKLLELLQEAGSKFQVPANVLLGILRLEGGHRGAGTPVWEFTDAQVEQAIATKDPFCVRNEACAAGPFQMLTNPNEFQGSFTKEFGNNCPSWPGANVWARYGPSSGSANPNPCNLRDAAFAAAAHVKERTTLRRENKLGVPMPKTCTEWDESSARDGWFTYHGNCSLGYCDTAMSFLQNNCTSAAIAQPSSTTPQRNGATPQ